MSFLVDLKLWERFQQAVENLASGFVESLPELLFSFILLIATVFAAKIVERFIRRSSSRIQKKMRIDETKFTMLRHLMVGFVYLIGLALIFYTIPQLQRLSTAILASVGFIGIIFGIAAQDSFGNLVSGVALVFFQPFRVGDLITVDGNYGRVMDINLRQTAILTSDDRIIIIPNSTLNKETVINWTYDDTIIQWSFTVPISNDSDIDRAFQIMIEEARKNPYVLSKEVLDKKKPGLSDSVKARVSGMDGSETTILLDFWVNDRSNAYSAEYAIREGIKRRFTADPLVELPTTQIALLTPSPTGQNLKKGNDSAAQSRNEKEEPAK
ncbi:MAG: mechanosensitive ion channel family protein [Methanosarcinales archaeon]|jgi:small-conductance mechanosensitive channel|nr:mechanosensitive ion channel family protein [Methanosarcinales archaeon]